LNFCLRCIRRPYPPGAGKNRGPILRRLQCGDWGDLDADDKQANDLDLKQGGRLLSRYDIEDESFYVITEWDREVTTVMLRGEY
jgi:hypothetical protein